MTMIWKLFFYAEDSLAIHTHLLQKVQSLTDLKKEAKNHKVERMRPEMNRVNYPLKKMSGYIGHGGQPC